jgi:hypothetical protein
MSSFSADYFATFLALNSHTSFELILNWHNMIHREFLEVVKFDLKLLNYAVLNLILIKVFKT